MTPNGNEVKHDFKVWLTERLTLRLRLLFEKTDTGRMKYGVFTVIAEQAIDQFLRVQAAKLERRDMEGLETGSDAWWAEMRRRAANDELGADELRALIDLKREGRKTIVGQKTKAKKGESSVKALSLDELL